LSFFHFASKTLNNKKKKEGVIDVNFQKEKNHDRRKKKKKKIRQNKIKKGKKM